MALLDTYVRTLFDQRADAVGIASGHPVLLMARGERRPLGGGELMEPSDVEGLLEEVLPMDELLTFQNKGLIEHIYASPSGAVKLTARRANGGMQLMVVPATRTTPAPRGPISTEGDPVVDTHAPMASPFGARGPQPASALQVVRASEPVQQTWEPPPVQPVREPVREPVRHPPVSAGEKPIDTLFRELVKRGGSDLYICTGKKPLIRKDGDLTPIGAKELTEPEVMELLFAITPPDPRAQFDDQNDTDFAYEIAGLARFRANLFRDRMGMGGIFRQIPVELLTAEKLGLSQAILDLCMLNKGLVLVTGPTGSGKSTTLAAMVDYINRNRSAHIITIEDPIEFVHSDKRCVINQREVGSHTEGFKRALRAALREDPDIVLVGEMRDLETVAIAIETAETGHLVFGTLHTNTAASTVDRIIDQFPADQQQQIRTMLAEALKGVISQTLLKKKGGGRVAALEVLLCQHAVSNLIREAKTHQLPSVMQTGKQSGMMTLNDAMFDLIEKKLVTPEEAVAKAVDKVDLKNRLQRAGVIVTGAAALV